MMMMMMIGLDWTGSEVGSFLEVALFTLLVTREG